MDQNIKQKWVEALRSGEYEQGQKALSVNGKYCCLGVLCEIAVAEGVLEPGVELPEDPDQPELGTYKRYNNLATSYLPTVVRDWAGMADCDGMLPEPVTVKGKFSESLAVANDRGLSFNDIAQLIEENF